MSNLIKKSLVASALTGVLALSGTVQAADPLEAVQKADALIHKDAAKSQAKIDGVFEQSQVLLEEYRTVMDEVENQKIYNDHVARLVADQEDAIASLQEQIDGIEDTKRGVVPLMYKMIETLEQFVALDIPINMDERTARITKLRDIMSDSSVTTSEKYRQVLEAYLIENEYGSKIRAYQGELEFEGRTITVDFFHLGRVAFVAQSLDLKHAWAWDNESRKWVALDDEFLRPTTLAIRMARKQTAFDLVKLPIKAAESAK